MSLYYKIILLHFKHGFSIEEISMLLNWEIRHSEHSRGVKYGNVVRYAPAVFVENVINTEKRQISELAAIEKTEPLKDVI